MRTRLLACGLLAVALPVAAGCSSPSEVGGGAGRGWIDGAPAPSAEGAAGTGGDALAASGPSSEGAAADDRASAPAVPATALPGPSAPATAVTAGSVDDNERFDDYLTYRGTASKVGLHDVEVAGRRVVRVVAGNGHPVLGARVVVGGDRQGPSGPSEREAPLLDARTHSDGRVLFLPRATEGAGEGPWPVTVEAGGTRATATLAGPDLTVTLGATAADPVRLDVVFLLDATGSMGDELDRLTANMASTASTVAATAGPGSKVRFGLTAFKDRGDEYVTRTFDLTGDVDSFRAALGQVKAGGGGDKPESVATGLHEAVTKPAWGGDDVAKVIVLVGDAAPHTDYDGEPSYAADARAAAARGIRLHAIASSGLDDQGEYAFRQMAQLTAGRFVFLTYGADGGPGASTPHHVDKYSVKSLDELVATLLTEELRPGRQTQ
jgi:hypothetical protein